MFRNRFLGGLVCLCLLLSLIGGVAAVEVDIFLCIIN